MRQDDIVILIEEDKDWALVENAISASQGYVPRSFIAAATSLESEPVRTRSSKLVHCQFCSLSISLTVVRFSTYFEEHP